MARRQPRLGAAELSDERAFLQAFGLTQAYEESRSATLPRTYAHLIPGIVSGAAGDDASGARGGVRFPGLHTLYDEKYVVFGRPIEYFSQSQWQSAFSMKGKPGPHPGGDVDDLLAIVRQSRAGNTAQSGSDISNAGPGAGAGAGGSAPHGRGAGAAGPRGHRARPSAAAILKQRTRPVAAVAPRRPRSLTTEDYKTLGLQLLVPELDRLCLHNPSNIRWGNAIHPFAVQITPKNAAALGVPTYFNVVEVAMDYTTMKEKASSGLYTNVSDFVMDLKLIAVNARAFNPVGSVIYQLGDDLQHAADEIDIRLGKTWNHRVHELQYDQS